MLWFNPRLPEQLRCMTFSLYWHGGVLRVALTHTEATYSLLRGEALELRHWGQVVQVADGGSATMPVPVPPPAVATRPGQPRGREPAHRRPGQPPPTAVTSPEPQPK